MNLKERIKTLCKENGITVNKLEKTLGFGTGYIAKLDNSVPNTAKIQLIADYFKVTVDYLMTGKETRFTVEQANIDVQLARQQKRIKEYMLKFANLSEEKRNQIMSLIDMLEDK